MQLVVVSVLLATLPDLLEATSDSAGDEQAHVDDSLCRHTLVHTTLANQDMILLVGVQLVAYDYLGIQDM